MFEDMFTVSSCIHTVLYILVLNPFQCFDVCAFFLPSVGLPTFSDMAMPLKKVTFVLFSALSSLRDNHV